MKGKTEELLRRERMDSKLSTLIDLFVATKQTEGRSEATVQWYRDKLMRFADFLHDGDIATISDVSLSTARAFVASLQHQERVYEDHPFRKPREGGLSSHTIHGYVRTLKVFSAWLFEEGFTAENVLERLKRPKVSAPVIEVLSDGELQQILASIEPRTVQGARQQLVFLLLLDTGIRASELCGIELDDVRLDQDCLKVRGKGNKERFVPICANTKKAILRYINTWRPEPASSQISNLVLSEDGYTLTSGALLQMIKRLGKRAGVPRLHPHLFRHTFAVKYLMNGGDVMTLKNILGHTTLTVTQMYMHLADVHVQTQHAKYSPADRLVIGRGKRR